MVETDRKFRMTRVRAGDYLLPSNDLKTLWRIYSYEEWGDAETWDGRQIKGTFWALTRRPMPKPGELLDLELYGEGWEDWAGLFKSRQEAIDAAMRT